MVHGWKNLIPYFGLAGQFYFSPLICLLSGIPLWSFNHNPILNWQPSLIKPNRAQPNRTLGHLTLPSPILKNPFVIFQQQTNPQPTQTYLTKPTGPNPTLPRPSRPDLVLPDPTRHSATTYFQGLLLFFSCPLSGSPLWSSIAVGKYWELENSIHCHRKLPKMLFPICPFLYPYFLLFSRIVYSKLRFYAWKMGKRTIKLTERGNFSPSFSNGIKWHKYIYHWQQ